jgi:hypothetical protein
MTESVNFVGVNISEESKSEILAYKIQMINAIRKRGPEIKKAKLDKEKNRSIDEIEKILEKYNLKAEELGEYANYQERFNSLKEIYDIQHLEAEIFRTINKLTKEDNVYSEKEIEQGKEMIEGRLKEEKSFLEPIYCQIEPITKNIEKLPEIKEKQKITPLAKKKIKFTTKTPPISNQSTVISERKAQHAQEAHQLIQQQPYK